MLHAYRGITPKLHPSVFAVESAQIIGDVTIGADSSVWFNAVIRGDVNFIRIGERTNIQDGCLLHVRHQQYPLIIGSNVTMGHGAIAHACTIGDNCLIGMGATILNDAKIGDECIVAAGTLIPEGMEVPPRSLVMGVPGKVRRPITEEERKSLRTYCENYLGYKETYLAEVAGGSGGAAPRPPSH